MNMQDKRIPPLGEKSEQEEQHGAIAFLLIVLAVIGALFLALGDGNKKPTTANGTSMTKLVIEWTRVTHQEFDGMSCRTEGSATDCDVSLKDGSTAHLRCNETGCAERDKQ